MIWVAITLLSPSGEAGTVMSMGNDETKDAVRTRDRSGSHRDRIDLDPQALARTVDQLSFNQLYEIARDLLGRFALVAESPGLKIHQDTVHGSKAASQQPRSTPMCDCGCPSRRDHWESAFQRAIERDTDPSDGALQPKRLIDQILCAAWDLENATKAPRRGTASSEKPLPIERTERIVTGYHRMPAAVVAEIESNRFGAGYITPEAVRRTRRANDLHAETGEPMPSRADRRQEACVRRWSGDSFAKIADDMDVAPSTVMRWCQEADAERIAA